MMSTATNTERNLFYLHELTDYKVTNSDKDVRGWPVKDKDGIYIGTVDNLLISKEDERVVYLDLEMDKEIINENHKPYSRSAGEGAHVFLNKDGENHIIIPVGMVTLDTSEEIVSTPKIGRQIFSETKRITQGSMIDRHYETSILESYNRDYSVDFSKEERKDNNSSLYKRKQYTKMYAGAY